MRTIVHVNRHMIAFNTKHGADLPCYTVKRGASNRYAYKVTFTGPSWLVDTRDAKPLSCGARAWIETDHPVTLLGEMDYKELCAMKHAIAAGADRG